MITHEVANRRPVHPRLLGIAGALSLLACDNGAESGGERGAPVASPLEISSCKSSCNQLKFFACNDAVEHAQCFADCEVAGSAGIELFNACVQADICDATCTMNIRPASPTPVDVDRGACELACQAMGDAGCLTPDLLVACRSACLGGGSGAGDDDQVIDAGVVIYCNDRRRGCEFPPECGGRIDGGGRDTLTSCQESYEDLAFFGCIQPADQTTCRSRCATLDESTRMDFVACETARICEDDACYRIVHPAGASGDVTGCQAACDQVRFFECLTAGELSACRSLCSSAGAAAIETFKGCAQGVCDGPECYELFAEMD